MNMLILRFSSTHIIGAVGAMVLLLTTTLGWAETGYVTGSEISKVCANYPDGSETNVCELYVSSAVEFVTSNDQDINPKGKLCIDEKASLAELVPLINNWLSKNPEYLSKSMYDTTHDAFSLVYQCE
jgi:hypothetical protein